MTRSTITREESIQAVFDLKVGYTLGLADIEILKRLARMALATLASEPVAEVYQPQNAGICAPLGPSIRMLCPLGPGEKLYRHAQPAPVVPDDVLDALQKVARIRLDLNDFDGDRRGITDCLCDAEEALIEVVNRRAAMLAAAQQPPGSEPATVPGKWIPVSERLPDCWCLTCRPVVLNDMRFVLCPDCGNKRCPRANDHRNACTGSNEPGQEGGAYPDTPQEVKP